ncbi:hypothetical protein CTAYLR_009544 [Chrysophaeum taylorii]|uniref:Uncharacterized protein n=1 Tax=Chrysophaeum taylorii TaxID=2483200 RepID=A0AAD7XIK2_9STRA|nr:hypothetical protein CTAYLR_009544 [Chrysophaeum taylorii]
MRGWWAWGSAPSLDDERAVERRRTWTQDFATCVFTLWDLRRKLRLRGDDVGGDAEEDSIFPWTPCDDVESAVLGHPSDTSDRLRERRRRVRDDIDDRFPGLLSREESGAGTYAWFATEDVEGGDVAQMRKDFARETVVVAGLKCVPRGGSHFETVRSAIARALSASTEPPLADALADAAMVASWRTKLGADAWDRTLELKRHLACCTAPGYALVSRPTEPLTSVAVYPRRVVVTAHSHLCEVKCEDDDQPRQTHWWRPPPKPQLQCGDERAFFALTTRTTVAAVRNGSAKLHSRKCLLAVVLVATPDVCQPPTSPTPAARARDCSGLETALQEERAATEYPFVSSFLPAAPTLLFGAPTT